MARYGREFRGERSGSWRTGEPGYGWVGRRGRFGGEQRRLARMPGYRGRRVGRWGPGYGIDYGGGERVYEGGLEWGRERGYPGRYDWEMRRPEGFRTWYGFEYRRTAPGFRRARGRAALGRRGHVSDEYRGRFMGGWGERERVQMGYGAEFGRGLEHPRYGHTPPDRWPGIGHALDERELDDRELREAVLENLFQDGWIDPERVDVVVENGVVTLTGEVDDFMEARYAWDDAWESPGVRGVINNLTVRTDVPRDDIHVPQTAARREGFEGGFEHG